LATVGAGARNGAQRRLVAERDEATERRGEHVLDV